MKSNSPLAERLRPKTLEDYLAQTHLTGQGAPLSMQIENGLIPSLILWGPPGVGKTTLAHIIAESSSRPFFALSAIQSGVKDVREVIEKAKQSEGLFSKGNPILFIDEIHRFSKSQQDSLLGAVEKGWVTLIGATTENPSFEVIPALLSRCQVYTLNPFEQSDFESLLNRAIKTDAFLKEKKVKIKESEALIKFAGGDARKLLNTLELIVSSEEAPVVISNEMVLGKIQKNTVRYDKTGEQHYDIISAFIKSIRGSDPQATIYWLARMIKGGEDPKFIARRMIISASEDIGIANPNALLLANSCFEAVAKIGMPESRIILSQCAVYLATSPKSNSTYLAIDKALAAVETTGDLSVPLHLRNAPTKLMKDLDYGKNYLYSHDFQNNFVNQEFMPKELSNTCFYSPGKNAKENLIKQDQEAKWKDKYKH